MNYIYKSSEHKKGKKASGEFAEQILADLISKGYSGNELLTKFKEIQGKIRPSVEKMLAKAKESANGKGESFDYDDVFGSEENR